jgi:hypothetical protein
VRIAGQLRVDTGLCAYIHRIRFLHTATRVHVQSSTLKHFLGVEKPALWKRKSRELVGDKLDQSLALKCETSFV